MRHAACGSILGGASPGGAADATAAVPAATGAACGDACGPTGWKNDTAVLVVPTRLATRWKLMR